MKPTRVTAIPVDYHGITFRSTLEATWAYNLDLHDITWSYEPLAVRIGPVNYLCDFYLPAQRVWFEVKGPHNLRIDKPRSLHDAFMPDAFSTKDPMVVVGRVPTGGEMRFHGISPTQDIELHECSRCHHHTFVDVNGTWACRVCCYWEKPLGGRVSRRWWPLPREAA